MQKRTKKNQARPEAPPAGQANAHDTPRNGSAALIEPVGRIPCFVLFEPQIGAVFFAWIQ